METTQLKIAIRELSRNRARTLLSLAAIGFGVVAILLAAGFVEWIFWAMRDDAIRTGLGHVQVSRPGFRETGFADPTSFLLPDDVTEMSIVQNAPHRRVVGRRLAFSGLVSNGETTIAFAADAVDPAAEEILSEALQVNGENLDAADRTGILLGRGLATALGVGRGDHVNLIVTVAGGGINAVEALVRGTFATEVKAYDDYAVRMPIALGQQLLRVRGTHSWVIALAETEQTDEAIAYLQKRLPADRFEIKSWFDLSDFYQKSVTLLSRQVNVVMGMIAAIIVLGISNTLMMSVLERTGEIGTIMAMGNRRRRVLQLFLLQGLLLGVAGAIAGLVVGFGLAQAISLVGIPMPPPPGRDTGFSGEILLTWRLAFWGAVIAVVPALLASLYPAWKASRLPIVDALRHNR